MNALAAAAALLLTLPAAPEPTPSSLQLDFLAQKADLVFVGVVQSVERVLDERSGRETTRFVTFEQLEVLAGRYDKNLLTLYFEWFPPELLPADYWGPRPPDFREGEEVVVFATAGNGDSPCPTVLMDRGVLELSRIDALDEPRVVLPGTSIRSDPADGTLGLKPTVSLTELKAVIASARLGTGGLGVSRGCGEERQRQQNDVERHHETQRARRPPRLGGSGPRHDFPPSLLIPETKRPIRERLAPPFLL